jgi:sarcosine oxidase subunit beta
MTSTPTVIIIGGGVLGLTTALELIDLGVEQITVVERKHPGEGSSGLSVGMVETQYFHPPDIEARVFGRRFYDRMARDHGLTFTASGYLRLGSTQADMNAFESSRTIQSTLGVKDAEVLTAQEISKRWHQVVMDDRAGGLFGGSDGYIDGYEYCMLASRLISQRGAKLVSKAEVIGADLRADGQWQLDTAKGTFQAELIVNAAGPWAGRIGELLGAPVPLHPQLHGALTINLPQPMNPLLPFVMDYVPESRTDGVYFRSERPDQLIAGLHTDEGVHDAVSPDVRLGRIPQDDIERVSMLMAERLNIVDDLVVSGSWQGIYPMSPDHRPIVGRHPAQPSVVCALGAGGSGIQLAPAVGRVAAESVLDHTESFGWQRNWSPKRIAPKSANESELKGITS